MQLRRRHRLLAAVAVTVVGALPISVGPASAAPVGAEPPDGSAPAFAPASPSIDSTVAPSITIVQNSIADAPQDFPFTGCLVGSGCSTFSLDDDTDPTLPNTASGSSLTPGTYTLTQAPTAGWALTDINCGAGETLDLANGRVTFTLSAGQDIICTFIDRAPSIRIIEDVNGTAAQDFEFTGCLGSGCSTFSLDDDTNATLPNTVTGAALAPGTYTITQTADAVWPLTGLTCNTPQTIDLANRRVTITVGATDFATCTFANDTQSITIVQDTVPNSASDFAYTGCLGAGCSTFNLDDDTDATLPNTVTGAALAPGTYTVAQVAPSGYALTGLTCTTGETTDVPSGTATITLTTGEDTTCTYTDTPVDTPLGNVVAVHSGGYFSCALLTGGQVACWGGNGDGELGVPAVSPWVSTRAVVATAPITAVTGLTLGSTTACALLTNARVQCWGRNAENQRGIGSAFPHPVTVVSTTGSGALEGVSEISGGGTATCARVSTQVRCWGTGALGDGSTTTSNRPVVVASTDGEGPLTNVTQMSFGGSHGCVVLDTGRVQCWGNNGSGELGDGTTTSHTRPVTVLDQTGTEPLTNVAHVDVNYVENAGGSSCATLVSGELLCWGNNATGTGASSPLPVPVPNPEGTGPLTDVTQVEAGYCAVRTDTTVVCWGGYRGDGTPDDSPLPVVVLNPAGTAPLTGVATVSSARDAAGSNHQCVSLTTGQARCWGRNYLGRLGDGTNTTRFLPVTVLSAPP